MHLTATLVSVWRRGAPVAPLLKRIASEQLMLDTSAATVWLDSGAPAEHMTVAIE